MQKSWSLKFLDSLDYIHSITDSKYSSDNITAVRLKAGCDIHLFENISRSGAEAMRCVRLTAMSRINRIFISKINRLLHIWVTLCIKESRYFVAYLDNFWKKFDSNTRKKPCIIRTFKIKEIISDKAQYHDFMVFALTLTRKHAEIIFKHRQNKIVLKTKKIHEAKSISKIILKFYTIRFDFSNTRKMAPFCMIFVKYRS